MCATRAAAAAPRDCRGGGPSGAAQLTKGFLQNRRRCRRAEKARRAAVIGAPVSTTHVTSSSIMGIGASERPRAVRWRKAGEIVTTWFLTIPGSALVGIITYYLVKFVFGLEA